MVKKLKQQVIVDKILYLQKCNLKKAIWHVGLGANFFQI